MAEGSEERVLTDVWDLPTRVIHWINAFLIITLALLMAGKEEMELLGIDKSLMLPVKRLHAYIGYAFVFTLALRVWWGFRGNTYARWSDIIPLRKEKWRAIAGSLKWYMTGFKGRPPGAAGHDPLASVFYTALFLMLIVQAATGLVLAGAGLKLYPVFFFMQGMSAAARESLADSLKEIHEFGFWFMMFFLAAHLSGLVVHEVKEKAGLFSSMIHGKKYLPKNE